MLRAVLLLVLVAALLAGCGDAGPHAETTPDGSATSPRATDVAGRSGGLAKIVGRRWLLTSIGGRDGTLASVSRGLEPTTLTIEENGDVILFVSCGRGAGRARVRDDGFIDFKLFVLTTGCDRAAGRVAAAVEALLDGRVTVAAELDGDGHLSLARDGRHLVFAPVR